MSPERNFTRGQDLPTSRFSSRANRLDRKSSKERSRSREPRRNRPSPQRRIIRYRSRSASHERRTFSSARSHRISNGELKDHPSRKIFVTNLSRNVTDQHLREIFESFGELTFAEVATYENFKISNSTAHLIFKLEESAEKAMKLMNRGQIDGLIVSLEYVPYHRDHDQNRRSHSSSVID